MLDNNTYIGGGTNNANDLVFGIGGIQAASNQFATTVTDVNDPANLTQLDRTQRLLSNGDDSEENL